METASLRIAVDTHRETLNRVARILNSGHDDATTLRRLTELMRDTGRTITRDVY